jgi:hypothetical protein
MKNIDVGYQISRKDESASKVVRDGEGDDRDKTTLMTLESSKSSRYSSLQVRTR